MEDPSFVDRTRGSKGRLRQEGMQTLVVIPTPTVGPGRSIQLGHLVGTFLNICSDGRYWFVERG